MSRFSRKNCPQETHEINANGNCVKRCPEGSTRGSTGRCRKVKTPTKRYSKKNCPQETHETNKKGNCVKRCNKGQTRNSNGRCVKTHKFLATAFAMGFNKPHFEGMDQKEPQYKHLKNSQKKKMIRQLYESGKLDRYPYIKQMASEVLEEEYPSSELLDEVLYKWESHNE